MKNQSGCAKLATLLILFLGVFALVAVSIFILIDYSSRRQRDARAQYAAPMVRITSPEDSLKIAVGSHMTLSGTVFFSPQAPVKTIEWWLDGTRLESQSVQPATGDSVSYSHYDLLVPVEGNHLLFMRAINSLGVIGNSQPITFEGTAKGDAYYAVTLAEGETLENVAAKYGTDAAALQNLNPGLNGAPTGTTIKVPIPPEDEPAAPAQTPMAGSVAPLVPSGPMLQVADAPPLLGSFLISAPPQAPTDLQGEVKDCKVKLIWQDNATNESGYELWMAAGGSALTRLAKLQPASGGAAWFEFNAPGPGYFLFWVEAVNPIGAQGSNIIYLDVDPGCPAGAPTHLQAEILDITVNAAADRIYCYVSFENAPEVRLPAWDGKFINVQNGHGDLVSWPHAFAVPFPQDGVLDITGECLGWLGNNLSKLGNFAVSADSAAWNGSPILAHGSAFDVSLSLTPVSQTATDVRYTTSNNESRVYNVRLEREEDPFNCKQGCWVLNWDFDPGSAKESDFWFKLYWYDEKNPTAPRDIGHGVPGYSRAQVIDYQGTEESLIGLFGCDAAITFEVATVIYPETYSIGTLKYRTPKCPAKLTVKFDTLELPWTGEGINPGPCDDIDVYYTLRVNGQRKDFWGGCSFGTGCFLQHLSCGTYTFKELASPTSDPSPDSFTVAVYGDSLALKIVTLFHDYDWGSGDDVFAPFFIEHKWPTRSALESELGCQGKSFVTDKHVNDTADSILHYTITYHCQ